MKAKILDASVARTPISNGTRDRQRLKASRLLGGYIAGGILTEQEAKAGIATAVERNTDQLQRAWRVIERGLRYGEAVPITLEHLDAEYQRWLATHPRLTAHGKSPLTGSALSNNGTTLALDTPTISQRRHAARIARYRQQLDRDPYFGAPERRGKGIPVAKLIYKETSHA